MSRPDSYFIEFMNSLKTNQLGLSWVSHGRQIVTSGSSHPPLTLLISRCASKSCKEQSFFFRSFVLSLLFFFFFNTVIFYCHTDRRLGPPPFPVRGSSPCKSFRRQINLGLDHCLGHSDAYSSTACFPHELSAAARCGDYSTTSPSPYVSPLPCTPPHQSWYCLLSPVFLRKLQRNLWSCVMRAEGGARNHGRKVESAVYYIDSDVHTRTRIAPLVWVSELFPVPSRVPVGDVCWRKKATSNDTSYLAFKTYVSAAAPGPAGY